MRALLLALLTAAAGFAAEDPWIKVRELKTGAELRIYKTGAKQPVLAKLDEAREDSLVVVLKNAQVAIAKEEIERIDFRPAQKGRRTKVETKTTAEPTDQKPVVLLGLPRSPPGSRRSTSSGLTFSSGPDFETIYRRKPAGTPQK